VICRKRPTSPNGIPSSKRTRRIKSLRSSGGISVHPVPAKRRTPPPAPPMRLSLAARQRSRSRSPGGKEDPSSRRSLDPGHKKLPSRERSRSPLPGNSGVLRIGSPDRCSSGMRAEPDQDTCKRHKAKYRPCANFHLKTGCGKAEQCWYQHDLPDYIK
jgi:hypothetical protein